MFVTCPRCRFLVALDAQGQPLPRCPGCARRFRDTAGADQPPSPPAEQAVSPPAEATPPPAGPTPDAATTSGAGTAPEMEAAAEVARLPMAAEHAPPLEDSTADMEEADKTAAAAIAPATPSATQPAAMPGDASTPLTATDAAPAAATPAPSPPTTASPTPLAHAENAPAANVVANNVVVEVEVDNAAPPAHIPTRPRRARRAPASAPSFARTARTTHGNPHLLRDSAACIALALLLALQLLLSQRDVLAADATWRPLLSGLCNVAQCTLPPWREPQALRIVERDIRAHDTHTGVLRVSARFRNDARWPQPWPALRLTLSDTDGNPVAARIFQPGEYLAATTQTTLESGQTAAFSMDVVEPGPLAVAFTFDFE